MSDPIFKKDERHGDRRRPPRTWKILVVDDDEEVHVVTRLALQGIIFFERPLELISAYSGKECIDLLQNEKDVAVILMDVVMETGQTGLDTVDYIRNVLNNKIVRIVIRTGHPGDMPEDVITRRYDINDYKEKTELTTNKLYATLHTAINQFKQIKALDDNRKGLEHVIHASRKLLEYSSLKYFTSGLLEQLITLIYGERDAVVVSGIATSDQHQEPVILAAVGNYRKNLGYPLSSINNPAVKDKILRAFQEGRSIQNGKSFAGFFKTKANINHVIYVESDKPLPEKDKKLIDLFISNVAIVYENLKAHEDAIQSQTRIILLLSQAIEERSLETRYHIKRVSEYSKALGLLNGLSDEVSANLCAASMLHDAGKISIPDAILKKPGKLTKEERVVMETHAGKGEDLLKGQSGELLSLGALVAGQHHERWDGSGYPRGLRGEEIHLFGRIVALTDVFDALTSKRCYKEAWPVDDALEYIKRERGKHFEPNQVDLFLSNIDTFLAIKRQFVDEA